MNRVLLSPRLTPECVALVKHFEGRRLNAYTDEVGVRTIGYGHTGNVRLGDSLTPEQADELLRADLNGAQADVLRCVKVPLNDNEYSALVSLAFNIGGPALARSRCVKMLNRGDRLAAADEISRFVKGHVNGRAVTLRGLELRRKAERELFLCPGQPSQDGFMLLAGQLIPLPLAKIPDPMRGVELPKVTVTPMKRSTRKHLVAAVGLGTGAGAVPFVDNSSGQSIWDWTQNLWQNTGAADLFPSLQGMAADWTNRLMQLPQAEGARTMVSQAGMFLHTHPPVAFFLGAVSLFMLRSILMSTFRTRS